MEEAAVRIAIKKAILNKSVQIGWVHVMEWCRSYPNRNEKKVVLYYKKWAGRN